MKAIRQVLTLWRMGLLSSDGVVAWADEQILATDAPACALLELSMAGPMQCLKRPSYEFVDGPLDLSFAEEFSIAALATDLSCDAQALRLVKWAAQRAMGEDLSEPVVRFGYELDDLLDDRSGPAAAIGCLRERLPAMLPWCEATATRLLDQLPGHLLRPISLDKPG